MVSDSTPAIFRDFVNFTANELGVKLPRNVPTFLAKTVLGSDLVKILTTSMKVSNNKISKIHSFKYPQIQRRDSQGNLRDKRKRSFIEKIIIHAIKH